ncbi:MAG: dual specificity protein phosphatase family protein [Candidatus Sumerlaeaceae bacterium]|nr:dual specificity protein phosphatase family protein [Candidatus Sumerlaeaceae bacterium]
MLHNFSFVVEGVLAGCAHPAGAGDLRQALQSLVDEGIGALISLDEMGVPLHYIAEFGLHYLHVPVRDFGTPSFEEATRVVEFIQQQRQAGRSVAVHCHAGYGRTGTLLSCYLVSQGMPAREALKLVRQKRPGSVETDEQERFVEEFEIYWKNRTGESAPPSPAC